MRITKPSTARRTGPIATVSDPFVATVPTTFTAPTTRTASTAGLAEDPLDFRRTRIRRRCARPCDPVSRPATETPNTRGTSMH
ncbi:hypothetical protein ACWD5Q_09745 [Streptomyces sp. NPDC002513]